MRPASAAFAADSPPVGTKQKNLEERIFGTER